jgi:hypothetical protein
MRDGLEARRMATAVLGPPAAAAVPDHPPFQQVWQYAGLLGHPTPPAGGPVKKVVRLLRRFVKKLMNPWLDHQTRFNHTLLTELQAVVRPPAPPPLTDVYDTIRRLQDRLNECHHKVEQALLGAAAASRPADGADAAEDVFIQTRMPDPPGTALVLADNALTPAVLKAVGFTVLTASAADLAALPLKAGAFRVVLALGRGGPDDASLWSANAWATRAAVLELLGPSGRVFGSIRDAAPPTADALAKLCDPLRLIDHTTTDSGAVWAAGA